MATESALTLLPIALPVQPDDDEARRLLQEELAKATYREAEPSLLERAWTFFLNWLAELLGQIRSVDAGLGSILLAVGAVVVIAVAVILIKPRLNARKRPEPAVFARQPGLSAEVHRSRADAAGRAGNWDAALTERFRAITRTAEERMILDEQAGWTAVEVARQLQDLFGAHEEQLDWLASRFNEVHYGAHRGNASDYQRAVALDEVLQRSQPRPERGNQRWAAPA